MDLKNLPRQRWKSAHLMLGKANIHDFYVVQVRMSTEEEYSSHFLLDAMFLGLGLGANNKSHTRTYKPGPINLKCKTQPNSRYSQAWLDIYEKHIHIRPNTNRKENPVQWWVRTCRPVFLHPLLCRRRPCISKWWNLDMRYSDWMINGLILKLLWTHLIWCSCDNSSNWL